MTRLGLKTFQAFEIYLLIRRRLVTAGAPQHFPQALHYMVLRVVFVGKALQQSLVARNDPPGLVDGELLHDGDVHGQMQKWVGITELGRVIALRETLWIREQGMVLGMLQRDIDDQLFHPRERLVFTMQAPCAEEYFPHLTAILAEEHD